MYRIYAVSFVLILNKVTAYVICFLCFCCDYVVIILL